MRVTHILMKSISLEVINNHKTRFKTHILLCCISILGRLRNMKRAHIYAVLACLCVLLGYMIGGKQPKIVVGFSPNGQAESLVFDAIKGAESSIFVAAYTFTSKPIAEALLSAHKRGVSVYLVVDAKSKGQRYTAATYLANNGVLVRLYESYAIMHHKFMLIDGKQVQTGSFNYSSAARYKKCRKCSRNQWAL